MGTANRELHIRTTVSKHNSFQDNIDDILWEEICDRVRRLVDGLDEQFTHLRLEIDTTDY